MPARAIIPHDLAQDAQRAILEMIEYRSSAEVARKLGVNQGLVSRLINHGYCAPSVYMALVQDGKVSIVPTREYTPCKCGEFHPMQSCPKKNKKKAKRVRKPRQSFMVPLNDIDAAIERVEKVYGVKLEISD